MRLKILRALLKLALRILREVISEIVKQTKIVESVGDAIKTYIPMTSSWQGEAADAFRQEVQTRVLPEIASIIGAMMGISAGIERAATTIQDADTKAVARVEDLASKFRNIYRY